MLLLGAVIFALAGYLHAEHIAIEPQAGLRVRDDDRGVIYSQKQFVRRAVPLRITLIRRERQDLKEMAVGIAKIESLNAARLLVPVGKTLRTGGCVLYFVPAQPLIRAIHVADD